MWVNTVLSGLWCGLCCFIHIVSYFETQCLALVSKNFKCYNQQQIFRICLCSLILADINFFIPRGGCMGWGTQSSFLSPCLESTGLLPLVFSTNLVIAEIMWLTEASEVSMETQKACTCIVNPPHLMLLKSHLNHGTICYNVNLGVTIS